MTMALRAPLALVWLLQTAIVMVESGCRRTNPIWTTNQTELSLPTLTLLAGRIYYCTTSVSDRWEEEEL